MFTVLSNTRNSNLYLIVALAITVFVILGFAVAPSIATSGSAIIPATGVQDAYFEYLRGEKVMYANPVASSNALSAYHLGEKAIYANSADLNSALAAYHLGEKTIYASTADVSDALMAHHLGEKQIVNTLESAMWAYRMGEKDLK